MSDYRSKMCCENGLLLILMYTNDLYIVSERSLFCSPRLHLFLQKTY